MLTKRRRSILSAIGLLLACGHFPGAAATPQDAAPAAGSPGADARREVVVAVRRDRRVEMFDAATLESLGTLGVGDLAHRVAVRPDGRVLFVAQGIRDASDGALGCCGLFAVDLAAGSMSLLADTIDSGAPSPDSRFVYASRRGVEIFDAQTFERLGRIPTTRPHALYPSLDGRWLVGTSHDGLRTTLAIFDVRNSALARSVSFPDGLSPRGTWLRDQFYLFAYDGSGGLLWGSAPSGSARKAPKIRKRSARIEMPDLGSGRAPVWMELTTAGDRLVAYEMFGMKIDRRRSWTSEAPIPGGLFVIDPASKQLVAHLAPTEHFAEVHAGAGGRSLYGIDSGALDWRGPVRLLKLDAATGDVLAERPLETDVWSFAVAEIPEALIPRGHVSLHDVDRPSR